MVRSQQDTAALPASRPFAVGQAGYDYFADDAEASNKHWPEHAKS
jgi:hypothetical protein